MAGSFNHVVDEDGNLLDNEEFTGMVENLGDAYETVEEMFGMIWWLASSSSTDPKAKIEEARQLYKDGLATAKELNGRET